MPKIEVVKEFKHCDQGEIYPKTYPVGLQDVSEECAEIAIRERWARPSRSPAARAGSRSGANAEQAEAEAKAAAEKAEADAKAEAEAKAKAEAAGKQ